MAKHINKYQMYFLIKLQIKLKRGNVLGQKAGMRNFGLSSAFKVIMKIQDA